MCFIIITLNYYFDSFLFTKFYIKYDNLFPYEFSTLAYRM